MFGFSLRTLIGSFWLKSMTPKGGSLNVMRTLPPSTCAEIADRAALNERYVREWLGAMVAGRVIECDPATDRFSLPPEHAAYITRSAGADNIGVFTQYISLLGGVE